MYREVTVVEHIKPNFKHVLYVRQGTLISENQENANRSFESIQQAELRMRSHASYVWCNPVNTSFSDA
jgi:hypothetical protein